MNSIQIVKKCLENPDYLEGVSGAVDFLSEKGQGIGELRKVVDELNQDDLFNQDEKEEN